MDYHNMKRKELQALCKEHGIPANLTNLEMADSLASLLKVNEEKPLSRGRSCLKVLDENLTDRESEDVDRKSKKVKFSPDIELFEFAKSVEVKRVGRRERKPVLNNGILDLSGPTRVTRSKGVKFEVGVIEKKSRRRHTKESVVSLNESTNEVGVSTRRSSRNKGSDEVVDLKEKRNSSTAKEEEGVEGPVRRNGRRKPFAPLEKLGSDEVEFVERKRNVSTANDEAAVEAPVRRNDRRKSFAPSLEKLGSDEVAVVKSNRNVSTANDEEPVEAPVRRSDRRKSIVPSLVSDEVVTVKGKGSFSTANGEEQVEAPVRRNGRHKSVVPSLEGCGSDEVVAVKGKRNVSTADGDGVIRNEGTKDKPSKALKRSKRLETQAEGPVLVKDDIAENVSTADGDDVIRNKGTKPSMALKRSKRFETQAEGPVLVKDDIAENKVVARGRNTRKQSTMKPKTSSHGTNCETDKSTEFQGEVEVVLPSDKPVEEPVKKTRRSRRNDHEANVGSKLLDESEQDVSLLKEERRPSRRNAPRNTLVAVSDEKKVDENRTKRNRNAVPEKSSLKNKFARRDLDSLRPSKSSSTTNVEAVVVETARVPRNKQQGRQKRSKRKVEVPMPVDREIVEEPDRKDCNISGSDSVLNEAEAVPDDVSIGLPGTNDVAAVESNTLADELIKEKPLVDTNASLSVTNSTSQCPPNSDPSHFDARPGEDLVEGLLQSDHGELSASKCPSSSSVLVDDSVPTDITFDKPDQDSSSPDNEEEHANVGLTISPQESLPVSQLDNSGAGVSSAFSFENSFDHGMQSMTPSNHIENCIKTATEPLKLNEGEHLEDQVNEPDEGVMSVESDTTEAPASKCPCPSSALVDDSVPNYVTFDNQEQVAATADITEEYANMPDPISTQEFLPVSQLDNSGASVSSAFSFDKSFDHGIQSTVPSNSIENSIKTVMEPLQLNEGGHLEDQVNDPDVGVMSVDSDANEVPASKSPCPSSALVDDSVPNNTTFDNQEQVTATVDPAEEYANMPEPISTQEFLPVSQFDNSGVSSPSTFEKSFDHGTLSTTGHSTNIDCSTKTVAEPVKLNEEMFLEDQVNEPDEGVMSVDFDTTEVPASKCPCPSSALVDDSVPNNATFDNQEQVAATADIAEEYANMPEPISTQEFLPVSLFDNSGVSSPSTFEKSFDHGTLSTTGHSTNIDCSTKTVAEPVKLNEEMYMEDQVNEPDEGVMSEATEVPASKCPCPCSALVDDSVANNVTFDKQEQVATIADNAGEHANMVVTISTQEFLHVSQLDSSGAGISSVEKSRETQSTTPCCSIIDCSTKTVMEPVKFNEDGYLKDQVNEPDEGVMSVESEVTEGQDSVIDGQLLRDDNDKEEDQKDQTDEDMEQLRSINAYEGFVEITALERTASSTIEAVKGLTGEEPKVLFSTPLKESTESEGEELKILFATPSKDSSESEGEALKSLFATPSKDSFENEGDELKNDTPLMEISENEGEELKDLSVMPTLTTSETEDEELKILSATRIMETSQNEAEEELKGSFYTPFIVPQAIECDTSHLQSQFSGEVTTMGVGVESIQKESLSEPVARLIEEEQGEHVRIVSSPVSVKSTSGETSSTDIKNSQTLERNLGECNFESAGMDQATPSTCSHMTHSGTPSKDHVLEEQGGEELRVLFATPSFVSESRGGRISHLQSQLRGEATPSGDALGSTVEKRLNESLTGLIEVVQGEQLGDSFISSISEEPSSSEGEFGQSHGDKDGSPVVNQAPEISVLEHSEETVNAEQITGTPECMKGSYDPKVVEKESQGDSLTRSVYPLNDTSEVEGVELKNDTPLADISENEVEQLRNSFISSTVEEPSSGEGEPRQSYEDKDGSPLVNQAPEISFFERFEETMNAEQITGTPECKKGSNDPGVVKKEGQDDSLTQSVYPLKDTSEDEGVELKNDTPLMEISENDGEQLGDSFISSTGEQPSFSEGEFRHSHEDKDGSPVVNQAPEISVFEHSEETMNAKQITGTPECMKGSYDPKVVEKESQGDSLTCSAYPLKDTSEVEGVELKNDTPLADISENEVEQLRNSFISSSNEEPSSRERESRQSHEDKDGSAVVNQVPEISVFEHFEEAMSAEQITGTPECMKGSYDRRVVKKGGQGDSLTRHAHPYKGTSEVAGVELKNDNLLIEISENEGEQLRDSVISSINEVPPSWEGDFRQSHEDKDGSPVVHHAPEISDFDQFEETMGSEQNTGTPECMKGAIDSLTRSLYPLKDSSDYEVGEELKCLFATPHVVSQSSGCQSSHQKIHFSGKAVCMGEGSFGFSRKGSFNEFVSGLIQDDQGTRNLDSKHSEGDMQVEQEISQSHRILQSTTPSRKHKFSCGEPRTADVSSTCQLKTARLEVSSEMVRKVAMCKEFEIYGEPIAVEIMTGGSTCTKEPYLVKENVNQSRRGPLFATPVEGSSGPQLEESPNYKENENQSKRGPSGSGEVNVQAEEIKEGGGDHFACCEEDFFEGLDFQQQSFVRYENCQIQKDQTAGDATLHWFQNNDSGIPTEEETKKENDCAPQLEPVHKQGEVSGIVSQESVAGRLVNPNDAVKGGCASDIVSQQPSAVLNEKETENITEETNQGRNSEKKIDDSAGFAGEDISMSRNRTVWAERKSQLTPSTGVAKTSFARHLNSTVKKNNARTVLIHGTPTKQFQQHDMKENDPSGKGERLGTSTAIRSEKRRPLMNVYPRK